MSKNRTLASTRTGLFSFVDEAARIANERLPGARGAIGPSGGETTYAMSPIVEAEKRGYLACTNVMEVAYDMGDAFEASIEKAAEGRSRLNEELKGFRSTTANDVASIAAVGEKIRTEAQKVGRAFESVRTLLNSSEMAAAIQNAERLAAALTALEKLKSARITFAVIDQEVRP